MKLIDGKTNFHLILDTDNPVKDPSPLTKQNSPSAVSISTNEIMII